MRLKLLKVQPIYKPVMHSCRDTTLVSDLEMDAVNR